MSHIFSLKNDCQTLTLKYEDHIVTQSPDHPGSRPGPPRHALHPHTPAHHPAPAVGCVGTWWVGGGAVTGGAGGGEPGVPGARRKKAGCCWRTCAHQSYYSCHLFRTRIARLCVPCCDPPARSPAWRSRVSRHTASLHWGTPQEELKISPSTFLCVHCLKRAL